MTCNCDCETDVDSSCAYFGGRALTVATFCEIAYKLELDMGINTLYRLAKAIIAAERKALRLPHVVEDLVE